MLRIYLILFAGLFFTIATSHPLRSVEGFTVVGGAISNRIGWVEYKRIDSEFCRPKPQRGDMNP